MERAGWAIAAGGLAMAGASIVGGAGYAVTPEAGAGRFGAFGDPWMEPMLALGGLFAGFSLLVATVWLAALVRAGRPRRRAIVLAGVLNAGYVAAAAVGLWISYRADPPLPPSWDWIRIAHGLGLAGAGVWIAGAWTARRDPPDTRRIPSL